MNGLQDFGGCDESKIVAFEDRNNLLLPSDYKVFLAAYNGGHLRSKNIISVVNWTFPTTVVGYFLGIGLEKWFDLQTTLVRLRQVMNPKLLAIATEPGGNYICFDYSQERRPTIKLWDHEKSLDEEGNVRLDGRDSFFIAESFTELVKSLESQAELRSE